MHEYLCGAGAVFPHSLTLDFGAVNVCSIGVAKPPKSALPMGMRIEENLLAASGFALAAVALALRPRPGLLGGDLCDDLLAAGVVGFVWVSGVDLEAEDHAPRRRRWRCPRSGSSRGHQVERRGASENLLLQHNGGRPSVAAGHMDRQDAPVRGLRCPRVKEGALPTSQ